jgi:pilus assembly protein CpaE
MSTSVHHSEDQALIVACTICRDVRNFDLLIEDMEAVLGENWGDLGFGEALAFFTQTDAAALEFVAIAMDHADEDSLGLLGEIMLQARSRNIRVILITEDVSPAALHHLLRNGVDEFLPYPLPEKELEAAIQRIRQPQPAPVPAGPAAGPAPSSRKSTHDREGVVMAVQGLAGGVGATTFAVNLAWELCNVAKKGQTAPRVCILDLDLQYGSVSTFLDLPRREAVFELLSDTEAMDSDSFTAALLPFEEKLHVLTSPADMLPLDLVTSEDINRIIAVARLNFDYVVIDMPRTLVQWTEAVLHGAHIYFAMLELDMRSAQNALRLKRALQAEDLPFQKLRFGLNRAPGFTDLTGKSRVKRLAESLGISIDLLLPDGGKAVTQAADHGQPLGLSAGKNPLRKEIAKLALSLHQLGQSDVAAA